MKKRKSKKYRAMLQYFKGETVEGIAIELLVPRSTVYRWAKGGDWKNLKEHKAGIALKMYINDISISLICKVLEEPRDTIKLWLDVFLKPFTQRIGEKYAAPKPLKKEELEDKEFDEVFRQWH